MKRNDFFFYIWTYSSWPDLDHTLLLEHFNVTYKSATTYVLSLECIIVKLSISSSHLYINNHKNWFINEFAQTISLLCHD